MGYMITMMNVCYLLKTAVWKAQILIKFIKKYLKIRQFERNSPVKYSDKLSSQALLKIFSWVIYGMFIPSITTLHLLAYGFDIDQYSCSPRFFLLTKTLKMHLPMPNPSRIYIASFTIFHHPITIPGNSITWHDSLQSRLS